MEGNVLRWIAEWLRDRKLQVQLNRHRSGWMEVRSGALQGSVLGPFIFTIFFGNIDEYGLCEMHKFADNRKIPS